MLPCFRGGRASLFVFTDSRYLINTSLVSEGSMTSSTYPLPAAMYGLLNFSRYSLTSFLFSATASFALAISLRKIMLIAASGPITAISAEGQARFTSARICFLPRTSYAPPYAFLTLQVNLGTQAWQYASRSFGPCRI